MRLIDADALKSRIERMWKSRQLTNTKYKTFIELLDAEPTIEPEPYDEEANYWHEKANSYEQTFVKLAQSMAEQPEIIRCKDCKYSDENWRRVSVRWLPCMDMRTGSNWYCGSAERREDG